MKSSTNRDIIINRIEREIIGPGSDIFFCQSDFSDEVIEGKPLQRYFSGILFPKQKQESLEDSGKDQFSDENEDTMVKEELPPDEEAIKEKNTEEEDNEDEPDTVPKYNSNAFYPSHFGLSFCISKECKDIDIMISFGNYKKARYNEVALPYAGSSSDLHLIKQFGLEGLVIYDEETGLLKRTKNIKRTEKGHVTADYEFLRASLNTMRKEYGNTAIYKYLIKLFFKDKYKRYKNEIPLNVKIGELLTSQNNHQQIMLSGIENLNTDHWRTEHKENLILHIKLYDTISDKYFIKIVVENTYLHKKDQFGLSKEKLNQIALFQIEIRAQCNSLLSFRDYHANLYKSNEDKMLDYLFRDKQAYGIGHNTSCIWENCAYNDKKVNWIKSTFLPFYDVKTQSTNISEIDSETLNIKELSSFAGNKDSVINKMQQLAAAYQKWIEQETSKASNDEYGLTNIAKCQEIYNRIVQGISLLAKNDTAYRAFQFANTAIYIQMFQTAWHFGRKDGNEVFEQAEPAQFNYSDYATKPYPGKNGVEPSWRPFQIAFILQSISSFVEEGSNDTDIVDLIYFPTGGGKTEAYLAVSAFLIFWRRLQYPTVYDGVNVIIRYTLRLLSAQQFERATKLILACEFIRAHHPELGDERISIGFWIGNATIPNVLEAAKTKLDRLLQKLNSQSFDGKTAINPFQLTNCQWCNSKIISRINSTDAHYSIGHKIDYQLHSYCLNPECYYNEANGGLPIVLVDEDIYKKPPTVLFATVDKFASLAWKEEATSLFNFKNNRKPELIIQDELHLLNGPLGSLVGLFENVILSLCTTTTQKPKIIASTATVKNVEKQIEGLYGKRARIFPQYATTSDDTFFSKTQEDSKRRYLGILPTGKTAVMTNLQLNAALFYGRLEVWEKTKNETETDQFWTILSYFKSLKELGRFSNKIASELRPVIRQLQARKLKTNSDYFYNYYKLPYRNIELTSRIPNEKIKRNLDKLEIPFTRGLKERKAFDLVLATNMISVGLDIERLGIMIVNGMPPNTAEYIQASSRVARQHEGIVVTLLDPFNTRDLSYFEDFVQFHKTFYKQVEPLSVTPFADSALDKMLFTLVIAYFRHKLGKAANNMAIALKVGNLKQQLQDDLMNLFELHSFAQPELPNIAKKLTELLKLWEYRIDEFNNLRYYWPHHQESLMKPIQDKRDDDDILVAMQSMRNVEPCAEIYIKQN